MNRLPRSFYTRPAPVVARALLGQRLVRVLNPSPSIASRTACFASNPPGKEGQRLSGRIIVIRIPCFAHYAEEIANGPY